MQAKGKHSTLFGDATRSEPPIMEIQTLDFRSDAYGEREITPVTRKRTSTREAGPPVVPASSPGGDR